MTKSLGIMWCQVHKKMVNVYERFGELEHYIPSSEFGCFDDLIESVCYGPFSKSAPVNDSAIVDKLT